VGPSRLTGRHALVTGGASGIGLGAARRLHAEGAAITLVDLNGDALASVGGALDALTVVADVTDEAQVEAAVLAAVAAHGPLHVAVNAAGIGGFGYLTDLALEEWRRVIDLCLTGVFLSMKHEARHLAESGSIVNIASLNARQPAEGFGAYCAAKAGVEMLTKVAAMELGPRGIRVNAVAPGLVDTPLTAVLTQPPVRDEYVANMPLGRVGTPEDVAALIAFLASDESSWMTGDLLFVDGGAHTKRYPELFRYLQAE